MDPFRPLPASFYRRSAREVAPALLGRYLVRRLPGERLVLRLVETEAYLGAHDRASHAWGGRRSRRNASLYLPPGHAYVYLIYGLHHCLNAVTGNGEPEDGSAVLLRAAEVVEGEEVLRRHRRLDRPLRPGDLAGGPGKLCQALAIDLELDGALLTGAAGPLYLAAGEPVAPRAVATGPRIGVGYAGDAAHWPLRFALRNHPEASRPRL